MSHYPLGLVGFVVLVTLIDLLCSISAFASAGELKLENSGQYNGMCTENLSDA